MANVENNSNNKESPPQPTVGDAGAGTTGFGVGSITSRLKREDNLKRGSLGLRGLGLLFSLLAFIIMATNKHGDSMDFDNYEEYRFLVAISTLSTFYTAGQAFLHVHQISTGKQFLEKSTSALVDFFGDQLVAYLLLSAASTAVPLTNRIREGADNVFTDASAASISVAFFAFFALAISALISGYKLSKTLS